MYLRLGLILVLVLASGIEWAGQPLNKQLPALLVRSVDADGKPVPVAYFTLWRALEPAELEATMQRKGRNGLNYYDHEIWQDQANSAQWTRAGAAHPNDGRHGWEEREFRFQELKPGRYRVTAVTYRQNDKTPDPTPYGVSEVLTYDGTTPVTADVVLSAGNAQATLQVIDAQSKKPIQHLGLRLRTANGMPIIHGHGTGNFFEWTSDAGDVRYAQLQAGEFTVQVLGKRAQVNNFIQYEPIEQHRRIVVEPGENTFEIAVEPRALSQPEIDKRFPFSVFGRVTDEAGNPIGSVEVRAATGVGTLIGGGRTTTDSDGKYRLYFNPGWRTEVDEKRAPTGVGAQAAHFYTNKPGWKLEAPEGYLFYLMTDQTRAQFEAMLKEEGGKVWGKDSADEVIFAGQPRELNLLLKRDQGGTR
jgi:hypothetical protein